MKINANKNKQWYRLHVSQALKHMTYAISGQVRWPVFFHLPQDLSKCLYKHIFSHFHTPRLLISLRFLLASACT